MDKMDEIIKAAKSLEGKQMPLLINGENWWPDRYITARVVKELTIAQRQVSVGYLAYLSDRIATLSPDKGRRE